MIGAGTVISPIIKIVTTVAILAAVYFFIVKPTLDTTEDITKSVNRGIGKSFDNFGDFSPDVKDSVRQAEKLQQQAAQASDEQLESANKLLDCIQDAGGDVEQISVCNNKFAP